MKRYKQLVIGYLLGAVTFTAIPSMAKSVKQLQASYDDIKIKINGQQIKTDKEPFVIEGSTYVPVRFVAENLNKEVKWDGKTSTIEINDKSNTVGVNNNENTNNLVGKPIDLDTGKSAAPEDVQKEKEEKAKLEANKTYWVDLGNGNRVLTFKITPKMIEEGILTEETRGKFSGYVYEGKFYVGESNLSNQNILYTKSGTKGLKYWNERTKKSIILDFEKIRNDGDRISINGSAQINIDLLESILED